MRKILGLTLAAGLMCTSAQAIVVVNSGVGEDLDGLPPFETVMAGVNYAISTLDPVVEMQTNVASGTLFLLPNSHYLPIPLTLRAGAGFTPVFSNGLRIIHANAETTVTVEGLQVVCPADIPLWAGANLVANNCTFKSIPGGGIYFTGVTAATGSRNTTSTMVLNNCHLEGHSGFQVGRSIENYQLTSCTVVAKLSDLPPGFSAAITNVMNWAENFGFRIDPTFGNAEFRTNPLNTETASEPFQVIQTSRKLNLNRCLVRSAGYPLAWPILTLDNSYYVNEALTHGPINAVNTVFEGSQPITYNTLALHEDQDFGGAFTHCTFRVPDAASGGIRFQFGFENFSQTFTNCLFDVPGALYAIGVNDIERPAVTGDGNVYYTPADKEYVLTAGDPWAPLAPFETTYTYAEITGSTPLTAAGGVLPTNAAIATAKAVALVPPVLVDKDNQIRPQPFAALLSDVGADEVDETGTSDVNEWMIF